MALQSRNDEEDGEGDGASYQLDMMRCLREVNVDNNTVGWCSSDPALYCPVMHQAWPICTSPSDSPALCLVTQPAQQAEWERFQLPKSGLKSCMLRTGTSQQSWAHTRP